MPRKIELEHPETETTTIITVSNTDARKLTQFLQTKSRKIINIETDDGWQYCDIYSERMEYAPKSKTEITHTTQIELEVPQQ